MSAETLDSSKEVAALDMEAFRKLAKYPLVRACDMAPDVREEAVDICITAVEKHQPDMERITQVIKDCMDKKFGATWHCAVGQSFAYEVAHETKQSLFLFVGGTYGVLLWKMG